MKLADVEYMTDVKVKVITTLTHEKCASLPRCEIKNNGMLSGACGFGATAREARQALASRISEETLVKNAFSDRMEWKLPKVTSR